jgi:hypothetical protein
VARYTLSRTNGHYSAQLALWENAQPAGRNHFLARSICSNVRGRQSEDVGPTVTPVSSASCAKNMPWRKTVPERAAENGLLLRDGIVTWRCTSVEYQSTILPPSAMCSGGGVLLASKSVSQVLSLRSTRFFRAGSSRALFLVTATRIVCMKIPGSTSGWPGVKCGPASTNGPASAAIWLREAPHRQ